MFSAALLTYLLTLTTSLILPVSGNGPRQATSVQGYSATTPSNRLNDGPVLDLPDYFNHRADNNLWVNATQPLHGHERTTIKLAWDGGRPPFGLFAASARKLTDQGVLAPTVIRTNLTEKHLDWRTASLFEGNRFFLVVVDSAGQYNATTGITLHEWEAGYTITGPQKDHASNSNEASKGSSLSAGAKAGISVGVVIAAILLAYGLFMLGRIVQRRRRSRAMDGGERGHGGFSQGGEAGGRNGFGGLGIQEAGPIQPMVREKNASAPSNSHRGIVFNKAELPVTTGNTDVDYDISPQSKTLPTPPVPTQTRQDRIVELPADTQPAELDADPEGKVLEPAPAATGMRTTGMRTSRSARDGKTQVL